MSDPMKYDDLDDRDGLVPNGDDINLDDFFSEEDIANMDIDDLDNPPLDDDADFDDDVDLDEFADYHKDDDGSDDDDADADV